MSVAFRIFLTNLGKYNEGEPVGEWVALPTTKEKFSQVMKRIGISQPYEEWFIGDYDCEIDNFARYLGEYANLNELNYLAEKIEELDVCGFSILENVLEYEGGRGIRGAADVINVIENLDCYRLFGGAYNEMELGWHLLEVFYLDILDELGKLHKYIDYEALGRDYSLKTEGGFVNGGYVEVINSTTTVYDGPDDIPDEYIILGNDEEE